LGHVQVKDVAVAVPLVRDDDLIRVLDEGLGDVLDELFHASSACSSLAGASSAAGSASASAAGASAGASAAGAGAGRDACGSAFGLGGGNTGGSISPTLASSLCMRSVGWAPF